MEISEANKEENAERNYTVTGNGMILRIRPMTLKAEGTYKCVASNSLGRIEQTGYLTVNCKFTHLDHLKKYI